MCTIAQVSEKWRMWCSATSRTEGQCVLCMALEVKQAQQTWGANGGCTLHRVIDQYVIKAWRPPGATFPYRNACNKPALVRISWVAYSFSGASTTEICCHGMNICIWANESNESRSIYSNSIQIQTDGEAKQNRKKMVRNIGGILVAHQHINRITVNHPQPQLNSLPCPSTARIQPLLCFSS